MYKGPLYIEEGKVEVKNTKIIVFCVVIALITIAIVVMTGLLAYKMIKEGTEADQIGQVQGAKTVGINENKVWEEKSKNTENTSQKSVSEQEKKSENKVVKFPKHNLDVAMESQLPQYSDDIAKKVVDVYFEKSKKVYLTFDDGPSICTPHVLDILDKYNVKATFFVLGSNVERNPELVKRAYDSGHFIASHGYTHTYSQIYAYPENVLNEYNDSLNAIRKAIGVENYNPHLFRFPGGSSGGKYNDIKQEAIGILKANQITYTNWNCLTGDSAGSTTIEQMWNELNETAAGDDNLVILMHDAGDKQVTVEFLPQLIEKYQSEGYEFCNYYDVMSE